ncbi:Alpha/Beta hydrolase protein [Amylocarpus encephaloides]|uniref:Kynurenine formamidase n=1 Tax=Amylocarpus encephaloides TaxID=45428 RepID=A0A9P7YJQ1_9HELO|nr:Alpha/Beta hydrolase protein [Amylocarpus encephaloides]
MPSSLSHETLRYGDHDLQTIRVIKSRDNIWNEKGLWVIYIHGGAWRDPKVTHLSFLNTVDFLLKESQESVQKNIAGFATIAYRLSPHPSYPQDPNTPKSELRVAKHPDHIADVKTALSLLQERYGFNSKYILAGHSCGATLAFQTALPIRTINTSPPFHNPETIVGVAGIYDMKLLVENHSSISAYRDFTIGAFGHDEKVWDELSPSRFEGYDSVWPEGKVYLFHSMGDELVDVAQVDSMAGRLREGKKMELRGVRKDLKKDHDGIWEDGKEMGEAVAFVLNDLREV